MKSTRQSAIEEKIRKKKNEKRHFPRPRRNTIGKMRMSRIRMMKNSFTFSTFSRKLLSRSTRVPTAIMKPNSLVRNRHFLIADQTESHLQVYKLIFSSGIEYRLISRCWAKNLSSTFFSSAVKVMSKKVSRTILYSDIARWKLWRWMAITNELIKLFSI